MSVPLSAAIDPIAPLRLVVEQILATSHSLLAAAGLDPSGGGAWLLAVAALVVVVRSALLPVVVGQFRSQRRMQALAPELRSIQDRYRGRTDPDSRAALLRATSELYQQHSVRPLGALLPLLIQLPVLLALVQVLEQAARGTGGALAGFGAATVLGVPLSAGVFLGGTATWLGIVILLVTAGAQVVTQLLASAPGAPVAQRRLLLALPLVSVAFCVAFPIGVTAYWLCSALWTVGQQAILTRTSSCGS